jgi:hypothetical protein
MFSKAACCSACLSAVTFATGLSFLSVRNFVFKIVADQSPLVEKTEFLINQEDCTVEHQEKQEQCSLGKSPVIIAS